MFQSILTNHVCLLPVPQPRQKAARANTTGGFIKTAKISAPVASTSAPASMERWAACPFAPATCPWRPRPVPLRSWSKCRASAASASTATREPPFSPRCTADPNLQLTRLTPSFPTRPTLTRSLIPNLTGSCTLTNPKRRRTPWATSWWRWGASGTSHVETSTWRVSEGAAASPQGAVCFLHAVKHHVYVLAILAS